MTDQTPPPEQQQTPPPPPPPPQPVQNPCPHCRNALEWVPQHNQWFCRTCNRYIAPAGSSDPLSSMANEFDDLFGGKPKYYCNVCGVRLDWVAQHSRWYCGRCGVYK